MRDYSSYSDHELVVLIMDGDRSAFAEIFNRYNDLLYNHAYNKLRDKEDAMDIVQDVFVKLWNRREQIKHNTNLAGYLYVMVKNGVFSLLSHKQIVGKFAESYNQFRIVGESLTDHRIRERQLAALIEEQISALPPKMREVFELSRKEELTHKQIAEKLGLSEFTVSDQIKKALKQLRLKVGLSLMIALLHQL